MRWSVKMLDNAPTGQAIATMPLDLQKATKLYLFKIANFRVVASPMRRQYETMQTMKRYRNTAGVPTDGGYEAIDLNSESRKRYPKVRAWD